MSLWLGCRYIYIYTTRTRCTLQWRHNGRDGVPNHQPHHCLLNRLFRRRSKKTSKLPVTGLCAGNSPVTGEFPAQMASNAENVSVWWRHHELVSMFMDRHTIKEWAKLVYNHHYHPNNPTPPPSPSTTKRPFIRIHLEGCVDFRGKCRMVKSLNFITWEWILFIIIIETVCGKFNLDPFRHVNTCLVLIRLVLSNILCS